MPAFRLDVFSHCVKVSGYLRDDGIERGKEALRSFCRNNLAQFETKRVGFGHHVRYVREMKCIYAGAKRDRSEFRFHIHSLPSLLNHLELNHFSREEIEIVNHIPSPGVAVKFKMVGGMTPLDYQVPIIRYFADPGPIKIITLQTGKGKTFSALSAAVEIGTRTVLIIKGMFVDRWMKDLKEQLGLKPGELLVVRGSEDLRNLIEMGLSGELQAKFIVITNKTMYNYIEHYEFNGTVEGEYGCEPGDFFQTIGAGLRIIDEVHMDFHLNFRLDLYTHVEKTISLSATMTADNPFINRMYMLAFPDSLRYKGLVYDKYIEVQALLYGLTFPSPLRFLRKGLKSYSHVDFEKSLMKPDRQGNQIPQLRRYLNMINEVVYEQYIKVMSPGQRMLVFAATVELCTIIADDLKRRYPDLYIGRYTADDDYKVLSQNDISVSTVLSAGTAVDIDGLRVVLMTTALNSSQSNEQALGRLRRLKKWPELTPLFMYFVCEDIPHHVKYHLAKLEVFKDKVVCHKVMRLNAKI